MKEHARRMVQLFPTNKNSIECECCQRHSAELQVVFEWRGEYITTKAAVFSMIGIFLSIALVRHLFHSLFPSQHIDFGTTHGFCDSCFAQIKKRRLATRMVKQLCLALIVLAAVILASIIVFAVLFVFPQPTKATITYAAIGLCGGLACLVAGLEAQDCIVRWCLPKNMRFISKPPFELINFRKV